MELRNAMVCMTAECVCVWVRATPKATPLSVKTRTGNFDFCYLSAQANIVVLLVCGRAWPTHSHSYACQRKIVYKLISILIRVSMSVST